MLSTEETRGLSTRKDSTEYLFDFIEFSNILAVKLKWIYAFARTYCLPDPFGPIFLMHYCNF